MTKSTQQLANELARSLGTDFAKDVLLYNNIEYEDWGDSYDERFLVEIKSTLLELLEVAKLFKAKHEPCLVNSVCPFCNALTNLQKKVEL